MSLKVPVLSSESGTGDYSGSDTYLEFREGTMDPCVSQEQLKDIRFVC